ncbi:MAG: ribose 5-phosphate isomerase A [Candidatus Schekmanbacteria bacterium RBG_13_48_7]|uniref:Ribose-5-phosphate isomerase A n=1 Tax=Candidatus Schekmanbacteria bacterium RBG_13_48_7 TaxID=1817878 RepID=A0A1F7RND1_9BACT|nr:MAG: ribose 5-phosphate isomerase A [Candidatus Schekmanbacteria bacterium RBG_13_48_7]
MNPKQVAGEAAAQFIKPGMIVGLGTGSTANFAISKLGELVKNENLNIKGVPTSQASENLAKEVGIPILSLGDVEFVDVTIDGADEIDGEYRMIKGGGGALLREKMVASVTKKEIIVVGPGKEVEILGKFPLPVEIIKFGWDFIQKRIAKLGCVPELRLKNGRPFITDNGNYILDCQFGSIQNPEQLEENLNRIPGVVENGLFIGLAHVLVIGTEEKAIIKNK